MNSFEFGKETARAIVAALVGFILAQLLRAVGAGRWLTAGASGALGSIAALAVIA